MPTSRGNEASATPREAPQRTVAPTMMTTRPLAARGVRPVRMREMAGRIRPRAPATSHTPMKRRNETETPRSIFEVNSSADMTSLLAPANRNSTASAPCVTHNATFVLLTLPLLETVPIVRVIVAIAVLLLVAFLSGSPAPQPAYQPSLHRRRTAGGQIDNNDKLFQKTFLGIERGGFRSLDRTALLRLSSPL